MAKSDAEHSASDKPRPDLTTTPGPRPSAQATDYIFLLEDWRDFRAGKVLKPDADLIGMIDKDGVKYRAATDFERRLGGFPD
jgi:hypothetical protein